MFARRRRRIFIGGTSPVVWPLGADGALVVPDNTTVTLPANFSKDYSSITMGVNSVLTGSLQGNTWCYLGCSGALNLDPTSRIDFTGLNIAIATTTAGLAPDGTVLFSSNQQGLGGDGGFDGIGSALPGNDHLTLSGNGGGGASDVNNGGTPSASVSGAGAISSTAVDGGPGVTGIGQNGNQGDLDTRASNARGGGGGGGFRGGHGLNVYIKLKIASFASVPNTFVIASDGGSSGSGGAGGAASSGSGTPAGGGGGGGGSGGNGGDITLVTRTAAGVFPGSVHGDFGGGGGGGPGGASSGPNAGTSGGLGDDGANGTISFVNF